MTALGVEAAPPEFYDPAADDKVCWVCRVSLQLTKSCDACNEHIGFFSEDEAAQGMEMAPS